MIATADKVTRYVLDSLFNVAVKTKVLNRPQQPFNIEKIGPILKALEIVVINEGRSTMGYNVVNYDLFNDQIMLEIIFDEMLSIEDQQQICDKTYQQKRDKLLDELFFRVHGRRSRHVKRAYISPKIVEIIKDIVMEKPGQ